MFSVKAKFIGSIIAILLILFTVYLIRSRHLFEKPATVNLSGANVILEIKELGNLETAAYTIEKIVEAGEDGNALQDLLFGDRILLIAHGNVVAGVKLSEITQDQVTVTDENLNIELPAPEILSSSLDNSKTRVYDRTRGFLTIGDKDLESEARLQAETAILQAACDEGILNEAGENAVEQVTRLFKYAGFESVTVTVPAADCAYF